MMLALRDIRHGWLRFLVTALGIALLASGTLTINGIYNGIVADSLNLVLRMDADLWVVEADTDGPFTGSSQLERGLLGGVRSISGVKDARRFDMLSSRVTIGHRTRDVTLLTLDYPRDRGDWLPLVAGRPLAALRGEAIVDRSSGIVLGATFMVGATRLVAVGVTTGMIEANGEAVVLVSGPDLDAVRAAPGPERPADSVLTAAQGYWPVGRTMAAAVVELEPAADRQAVARSVVALGASAMSTEQQVDSIVGGRLARMRLQILLFSALLTAITAVVVTLTIYTMTVEKQHTIALLKLVGGPPAMIAGLIVTQALLLAGLGALLGAALEQIMAPLFPRRVLVGWSDIAVVSGTIAATCMLGSAVGIAKAARVRAQEILS